MAKATSAKPKKGGSSLTVQVANMKKGSKLAVFFLSLAALGGLFFFQLYKPYTEELESLQSSINSFNNEVASLTQELQKHDKVLELKDPLKYANEYMASFLPGENEMPILVQLVTEIGSSAGVAVNLFEPVLPANTNYNPAVIPFTLKIEGPFINSLKFLYEFSRMDRIAVITSMKVENPKLQTNNLMFVSITCGGQTFRALSASEIEARAAAAKDAKK